MRKNTAAGAALAFAISVFFGAGAACAQGSFLFGAYPGEKIDQFETLIDHTISLDEHFLRFSLSQTISATKRLRIYVH